MSESFAVKESMRIDFTQKLLSLRDDDQIKEIAFPAGLSNTERKFLHNLAGQLGLKSVSKGKDDSRYITVSKHTEEDAVLRSAIPFELSPISLAAMKSALTDFPIRNVNVASPCTPAKRVRGTALDDDALAKSYFERQALRVSKSNYADIQRKRSKLPSFQLKDEVCKLVKENQITLISGETGCGKTTQVPQFLLDDSEIGPSCRMIVTQPRRLSAITVAERVSAEREERIGTTVGYNIRFESEQSATTQVLFVTPGVLLRKLSQDPLLADYSMIVLDEAHERDRHTEFLFIVLKDLLLRRDSIKLVLMSATLNTSKLSAYFGGIPQISLGGSVFPVQEYFLEDVIRFTDYVVLPSEQDLSAVVGGNNYYCSVCGHGPYKVAEELGSHAAFCLLPPGRQLSARRDPKSTRKLDAIVRSIFAANLRVSSDSSKPIELKAEVEDIIESSAADYDDDEDAIEEDVATKNVISVQALDSTAKEASLEDFTGGDPLLRQYQINFDDSLVDCELIMSLLGYVFRSECVGDGSVLVFLPGWDDICEIRRMMQFSHEFRNSNKYKVCLLHSAVPKKDQSEAFLPAKKGQHKIILATNVAETSITIDDGSVVIDTGKVKEIQYDPHVKLSYLKTTYVSKASARQRKGRAGRTRSGTCFHLFSRARHASLSEYQDSELLRMPLEELVLQTKILDLASGIGGASVFLSKAMDPPHSLSVENAITALLSIHCLDHNEDVTIIGRAVSKLPIEPKSAYAILLGCVLGMGTDVVKTIAAMSRDPFVPPADDKKRSIFNKVKSKLAQSSPSDQLALLNALEGYIDKVKTGNSSDASEYCDLNFLSKTALTYLIDVSQQMISLLDQQGINLKHPRTCRNNGNKYLLMSIISLGLYPGFCFRKKGATLFCTEKGPKAKIHPSSVNYQASKFKSACSKDLDVVGYETLIAAKTVSLLPNSASLLMIGTTPVSIFCYLLGCASFEEMPKRNAIENADTEANAVEVLVDEWNKLRMNPVTFQMLKAARSCLIEAVVQFVANPSSPLPDRLERGLDSLTTVLIQELSLTAISGT